jgi:NHLM bacteriocin system ABC transporter ATP-binding protein
MATPLTPLTPVTPVTPLMIDPVPPLVDARLAAALGRGAEPLSLTGSSPLRLDGAAAYWLVESGRMEVFAVGAPAAQEPAEAAAEPPSGGEGRSHLGTAAAGQLLCGLAAAGDERVLAVAAPAARLLRLDTRQVERVAGDAELREALGELLDGWLTLLGAALAPGPGPRSFTELRRGAAIEIEAPGRAVRPLAAVVWARQAAGTAELLGKPAMQLGAGQLSPVAPACWLIATTGPCRLTGEGTADLLASGELWPALGRYHAQVLALLAERRAASGARDRGRQERKTALDREMLEGAYSTLAAVLTPRRGLGSGLPEVVAEPLAAVCKLVAEAQGIAFAVRPAAETGSRRGEHLAGLCAAARVRYRRVILRGEWWKHEYGPLVGYLVPPAPEGGGAGAGARGAVAAAGQAPAQPTPRTPPPPPPPPRPVALLPARRRGYMLVDPAAGAGGGSGGTGGTGGGGAAAGRDARRLTVDAAVSESLAGEAFMLYKPLPERALNARDLARAAFAGARKDLWMLLAMGIASGLLALLGPIVTGQVFGQAIPDADRPGLLQLTVVLVVSALGASAFQLTRSFAVLRLSARIEGSVQAAVWDRLLALPVAFFRRYTVGDLADRSLGIDRIRELLTGNVTTAILSAVFSVFSFALLFYYRWQLALGAAGLVAVLVITTAALTWLQLRHQRELLSIQGKLASLLLGFIHGITKLQVAAAEERAFSRWAERFAEQRRRSVLARRIANLQATFNAFYAVLTSMVIFAMVGWSGTAALPVGDFLAFNAAFGQVVAAALASVALLSSLLTIVPLYERLEPILATPPEVEAEQADAGELAGEVEFSHVSFGYDEDGPLVLDDVSLRAAPGEFIALVGPSGSGKSTCLRLVLGFEKPASGSIYFDGQDLAGIGIQSVRRQIGVVMQHSRLMAGDLFSNIIGGANLTLEDAWEAARMAGLEEDIRAMPMGMHTVVSEGAGTFSGGQKQRLLIARAIVNRPRILLFDEATSALDNRTQQVVSRSLEGLKATRVVIAHRLSTIVNADRIYVIDAGRVVEVGNYRELVERGGVFAEMARRQIA